MKNNKQIQIKFSNEFTYNNHPMKYEIMEDNTIKLCIEDCVFALGLIDTKILNNEEIWNKIYDDLIDMGLLENYNKRDISIREKIKNKYISINDCLLLCNNLNIKKSNSFMLFLQNTQVIQYIMYKINN